MYGGFQTDDTEQEMVIDQEFKDELNNFLQNYKGIQNEYYKQLITMQRQMFKEGKMCQEWSEMFCSIRKQLDSQNKKEYIYNKTQLKTRNRAKKQELNRTCTNCYKQLNNYYICQYCGAQINYNFKTNTHPQDQIQKLKQFVEYLKGSTAVPIFVMNYVNKVIWEEKITSGPRIIIDFPFRCQTFFKKRSDIPKISQRDIDEYTPQKLCIPVWTFKQFKNKMLQYREKSKQWENSSYLPRDCIYLQACYTQMYQIDAQDISKEDMEYIIEVYSKLLVHETERKNKFVIQQFLIGIIQFSKRLEKYKGYLLHVKNPKINPQLIEIIKQIV